MEHLDILHWFSKYSFVCIPVLAFLLDLIIGDPNSKYHPVAIIGRIISFFEAVLYKDTDNDTKKLWYGGIAVGLILVSVYIIVSLILWLGAVVNEWVAYALEVIILYIAISPRSLAGAGFTISQLIKQDNIVEARQKLSWIVGRDTEVSQKHAGFVINTGNAKAKDVLDLIKEVQKRVYDQHGVHLEPEVRMIGEE